MVRSHQTRRELMARVDYVQIQRKDASRHEFRVEAWDSELDRMTVTSSNGSF